MTAPTRSESAAPGSTSSRGSRILGAIAGLGVTFVAVMGLVVTPPDAVQRDAARLLYVHVPMVIYMYVAVAVCAVGSAMWLRKRTEGWDTLAEAAAEIATLFTALGLFTGMVWGRPTWGVYWVWDARLTSTAILFVLLLGYQALRRYPATPEVRARLSALLGLLLVPNAMVVHYSVTWWRSLHQDATISKLDVSIDGSMLFTLMVAMVVMGVVFAWLLMHRFRVGWLERRAEAHQLDADLEARRADADPSAGLTVGGSR